MHICCHQAPECAILTSSWLLQEPSCEGNIINVETTLMQRSIYNHPDLNIGQGCEWHRKRPSSRESREPICLWLNPDQCASGWTWIRQFLHTSPCGASMPYIITTTDHRLYSGQTGIAHQLLALLVMWLLLLSPQLAASRPTSMVWPVGICTASHMINDKRAQICAQQWRSVTPSPPTLCAICIWAQSQTPLSLPLSWCHSVVMEQAFWSF